MTNVEIINNACEELVKAGKLDTVNVNGEIFPEPIHTFQGWKERGYVVKKGEKSEIKITIWKHAVKKTEVDGEEVETGSMFMKTAAFFKFSQVEKLKQ